MGAQAVRLSNVDIDNALKNRDFEVLFQPIFDLGNGALARMETFVRWRHPSLGVLPPGAFISFFETQGRVSELTRYVLGEALQEYKAWRGPYAPGFSINLAYSDLSDDSFVSHFIKLLREHDFPPELVTLECPMPPIDADFEAAAAHFARIGGAGARLAIEVRGRANEFLRSVDPFPFDEIKTGGSAILRFARTVRGPGLTAVSDLLDIASKANAAITAVGVEDQASLAALRGLGFTAAQGNHLGKVGALNSFRPARVNEVRELLSLEPLSQDSLTALFRTSAPEARAPEKIEVAETSNNDDALIERLNARVEEQARQPKTEAETTNSKPQATQTKTTQSDTETSETAPKRSPAVADAVRKSKTREARKAAAIARAKSKAAGKPPTSAPAGETPPPAPSTDNAPGAANAETTSVAPRAMQELISEEFRSPKPPQEESTMPPSDDKKTAPTGDDPVEKKSTIDAEPAKTDPVKAETPPPAKSEAKPEVKTDAKDAGESTSESKKAPTKPQTETAQTGAGQNKPGDKQAPAAPETPPAEETKPAEARGENLKLSVGGVGAVLLNELRLTGPAQDIRTALNHHRDNPEPMFAAAGSTARKPDPAPAPGGAPIATPPAPAAEAAPEPTSEAKDQPVPDVTDAPAEAKDTRSIPEIIGGEALAEAVAAEDEAPILDDGAALQPKRRKKNFLTRKYQIWPTHFWPRSWKRSWRRRAAARAAAQAEAQSAEATATDAS